MELEFRHLRVVRAIADAGSLTAAAAALSMSQPSVTESLRRAERAAGGDLFRRGHQGATPTPLGDLVLAHTNTVLDALDRLVAAAARHDALPATVRVGCSPGLLVANLTVAVPKVLGTAVEIRTSPESAVTMELLAGRHIEAGLVVDYPTPHALPDGVERAVVAVEPMFVSVADWHPYADRAEIDLAELAGEHWGSADTVHTGLAAHLAQVCASAGFTVSVRATGIAEGLLLAELGQMVLPTMPGSRPRDGLRAVHLAGAPLRMTTSLCWNTDGPLSTAAATRLWAELVSAQHRTIERTEVYRSWLETHPEWATTPPEPVPEYSPL